MNPLIYDYKYDYEQSHGHFLVIQSSESSQIQSDDLVKVQVNMLSSNEIAGVLPVRIEEVDFQVKLYFNISSNRILTHILRTESITMNELYSLLYSIAATVNKSTEYMLNDQLYIINTDFIYIGEEYEDVYLTYLPVNNIENKPTIQYEFRELLMNLVAHVQELKGNGMQNLMNYLNDPTFSVAGLLEKLKRLTEDKRPAVPVVERNASSQVQVKEKVVEEKQAQAPPISSAPSERVTGTKPKKKKQRQNQNKKTNLHKTDPVKETPSSEEEEKKSPNKIVVGAVSLLGLALAWKLYESIPSNITLYLSIGATIVILASASYFMFFFGKKNPKKLNINTKKPREKEKPMMDKKNKGFTPRKIDNSERLPQRATRNEQPKQTIDPKEYYRSLSEQTTLLSQPDATVLLEEEEESIGMPFLEIERKGERERIFIDKSTFTIGRNATGVEYVESTIGVSRIHLEITEQNGQYFAKDLGSKNGSKLNEQPMVAYKLYPLKEGDSISLGQVKYTFKMS